MIDFGSTPPTPEFNPISRTHLANYRRVYRASEDRARIEGDPKEALRSYLAAYDEIGASKVVIKARDVETTFGVKIRNEDVAAFCRDHAPRFIGFAGVDPHKGMAALRELERAVNELGLRGLNIQCFESKVAINDAKLYPLYAKCIELDIPVNIHVGINFSTHSSMEYGRPALLDQVMMHFPELRVIASPPGWPWVTELIGVAWRHPTVHIGLIALRPKYLAVPNSGYEPLLQFGNTVLQDRMIFGSLWPMQPIKQAVAEIEALPIKDQTKRKWLHENAARFLHLQ